MKSTTTIAGFLLLIATLFSCRNNNKENHQQSAERINMDAVLNSKSKNPDTKGDNSCLLAFREKYDALLSENDIISATGFDKEKMTIKYRKTLADPKYHEYVISFKNGRKGKIFGSDRDFELPDIITVREIESMSLNTFNNSYRAATDEESQTAQQVLEDAADGNLDNSDAKEVMKQAEAKNIDKENIKKTGSTLTNAFSEISKAYVKVDGLGDAAVWNIKTNELNVLQNGVKFSLVTDLSNDKEINKEVAISLAKSILDKCK